MTKIQLTLDQQDRVIINSLKNHILCLIETEGILNNPDDDAETRVFVHHMVKTLEMFMCHLNWKTWIKENKIKKYLGKGYKL